MKTLIILAGLLASTAAVAAPNLIPNGDFEAGNTGFTSAYVFSPASNTDEGQYTVRANAAGWNPFFLSLPDHTTGTGLYFVGNGSQAVNQIVYQSSPIAISAATSYFFEAFVANVCCLPSYTGGNSDPVLNFFVSLDGGAEQLLGQRTIPANQAGVFFGLSTNFNSGTATSAVLTLRNANAALAGNDFGLDDVFLGVGTSVVPAPGAFALFGLGIAALGLTRRRAR